MFANIQVSKRMEQATTSHGADTASNPMTRSVKSGVYVLLALVALVEGCSVGPRYKAPTPTIRPVHNPARMRADGASAPPLDTWWEGFGDPELTRIVQRALDQNLDLKMAVEALTHSLRYEVSQLGVEVVEVQPSAYPTNLFASVQTPPAPKSRSPMARSAKSPTPCSRTSYRSSRARTPRIRTISGRPSPSSWVSQRAAVLPAP